MNNLLLEVKNLYADGIHNHLPLWKVEAILDFYAFGLVYDVFSLRR